MVKIGTDAMVLADFAALPRGAAVCDLCAGAGAVGLLLLARDPSATLTAVELQGPACRLLERTVAENGLEARVRVVEGDVRRIGTLLPAGGFRHVVCNPPYFPVGAGKADRDAAFAVARTEICCTLADAVGAAAWVLQTGGDLHLVHRPERLTDLLCAMRNAGLEPKRLRLVRHSAEKAPSLVLVRAVRGGKPGLSVAPDLLLYTPAGTPTEEYRRIYHE